MKIMKELNSSLPRRMEEKLKFRHFLKMLIWAKERSGKSSAEITTTVLHKYKDGNFESCYY